MKICSVCKKEKELNEFSKDKSTKDGLCCRCKHCQSIRFKKYHLKNKGKINERKRKYRSTTKGQLQRKRYEQSKRKDGSRRKYELDYYYKNIGHIRNYNQNHRDRVSDYYIKKLLTRHSDLSFDDLCKLQIESKKAEIMFLRELKKLKSMI